MTRPTKDQWAQLLALVTSMRGTCLRRQVGCVLVNARGHVLATGYNGVAAGLLHCNQHDPFCATGYPFACEGAHAPSGSGLDQCEAVHAEQNALLQCKDVYAIDTCYVTASPCVTCTKLLLNTSCRRIVFSTVYPHPEAQALWERAGRLWIHQDLQPAEELAYENLLSTGAIVRPKPRHRHQPVETEGGDGSPGGAGPGADVSGIG